MEVVRYKYDLTKEDRIELSKILYLLKSIKEEILNLGVQMFLTSKVFDRLYNNKEEVWKYFYQNDDDQVKINELIIYGTPVHYILLHFKTYYNREDIIRVVNLIYSILVDAKCFYYFKD